MSFFLMVFRFPFLFLIWGWKMWFKLVSDKTVGLVGEIGEQPLPTSFLFVDPHSDIFYILFWHPSSFIY